MLLFNLTKKLIYFSFRFILKLFLTFICRLRKKSLYLSKNKKRYSRLTTTAITNQ